MQGLHYVCSRCSKLSTSSFHFKLCDAEEIVSSKASNFSASAVAAVRGRVATDVHVISTVTGADLYTQPSVVQTCEMTDVVNFWSPNGGTDQSALHALGISYPWSASPRSRRVHPQLCGVPGSGHYSVAMFKCYISPTALVQALQTYSTLARCNHRLPSPT